MGEKVGMPEWLEGMSVEGILRIDVGMEGDWSGTVVPVWSPDGGITGFDGVARSHPEHRPSLELYFVGGWVGLHCFRRVDGRNEFDEPRARVVIEWVERRLAEAE